MSFKIQLLSPHFLSFFFKLWIKADQMLLLLYRSTPVMTTLLESDIQMIEECELLY